MKTFIFFCLFLAANAFEITHFNVIRLSDRKFLRRLRPGDVLAYPFQFTFEAVASPDVPHVNFYESRLSGRARKHFHEASSRPFILGGVLHWELGENIISAYSSAPGEGSYLEVKFFVNQFGLPEVGPLTSVLPPSSYDSREMENSTIPTAPCDREARILFRYERSLEYGNRYSTFSLRRNPFNLSLIFSPILDIECLQDDGTWKEETRISRVSLLRILPQRRYSKRIWTQVKYSDIYPSRRYVYLSGTCIRGPMYFESCVKTNGPSGTVCNTSRIIEPRRDALVPPLLSYTPPRVLELAPGDRAKVSMRVRRSTGEYGWFSALADKRQYYGNWASFRLSILMTDRFGSPRQESRSVVDKTAILKVGGRRGATVNHDGNIFVLKFSNASCSDHATENYWKLRTRLVVNKTISPLIRQDRTLPSLKRILITPEIPTAENPATITAIATNPGGGYRADGTKTELKFQWYTRGYLLQYESFRFPEKIEGATGPKLEIEKLARLYDGFAGEDNFMVTWFYYVEICNTFGCRWSDTIDLREKFEPGYRNDIYMEGFR